jgi:DNA-binding transcriptional LysR family regulator
MDFRQLSYFAEVARHGSFTKASAALHLSQPTLSKVVKCLEDELGVTLFDRSAKHIVLTDAGATVLAEAKTILHSLGHLSDSLYEMQHLHKGSIFLGLPPIIASLFFPGIIAGFHTRYPNISIRLTEGGSKRVETAVENGDADLGIVVLPVEAGLFDVRPFLCERLSVIVPVGHPLAAKEKITLPELREEPVILLSEGFAIHERILEECGNLGFQPRIVYESAQWDFISEMTAEGMGLSFFPESLCQKLDSRRIRTLPLEGPVIPYDVAVITRKDRYLSYAAREFIRYLQEGRSPG